MKLRPLAAFLLIAGVLLVSVVLGQASPSAAQDQPERTQTFDVPAPGDYALLAGSSLSVGAWPTTTRASATSPSSTRS